MKSITSDPMVKKKLEEFSQRSKHNISIRYLLNAWEETIEGIEAGYEYSIYDYLNDLDRRDLIQELIDVASDKTKQEILAEIRLLDQRFIASTDLANKPLREIIDVEKHWWW